MSDWMAAQAASFTTEGAGKSGNPWERFTPPCSWFRRVISRMTDSVNCVAFFDPFSFDIYFGLLAGAFFAGAGLRAGALADGAGFFAVAAGVGFSRAAGLASDSRPVTRVWPEYSRR